MLRLLGIISNVHFYSSKVIFHRQGFCVELLIIAFLKTSERILKVNFVSGNKTSASSQAPSISQCLSKEMGSWKVSPTENPISKQCYLEKLFFLKARSFFICIKGRLLTYNIRETWILILLVTIILLETEYLLSPTIFFNFWKEYCSWLLL